MPKEGIKSKLDGNELDLSLSELTVVPVKDILTLPKATVLDLSCNLLTTITPDFCQLVNVTKIDLSKNAISELPESFGQLQRLQTLDLFSNKLRSLPVSLGHLKNLKWLDVKDNPLEEPLKGVAGDCLDENQCKKCARNVVTFMKRIQSEQERQIQKRLQEERELEAAKKAIEEQERAKKRAERKAEKEKRKREQDAKKKAEAEEAVERRREEKAAANITGTKAVNGKNNEVKYKKKTGLGCCGIFLAALIGLVAILTGLYFYCDMNKSDAACKEARHMTVNYYNQAHRYVTKLLKSK